jgi:phage host-nuclease inhibitor protein Gam
MEQIAGKGRRLKITSPEALDAAIARVVSLKNQHTTARAAADAEVVAVEKRHQLTLTSITDKIADEEAHVREYCEANRDTLFAEKKSRDTALADFGFEFTPPRVETASRKIKWSDVVARLLRLPWGKAYLTQAEPKPDKNALLADREQLSPEQLTAAGIQFCQDEQFFIRPKLETAASSKAEVKS